MASSAIQDLSKMDKGEVSKTLFGQIGWEEMIRSGAFLEQRQVIIFNLK